jgi:TadE-like protein
MYRPHRSDKEPRGLVRLRDLTAARRLRQDPEKGQALVEFALVLLPLLLIVVGIIQFGIALNYWLDMQRIANQGARWASVNNWPPGCPAGSPVGACDNNPATETTLQESLVDAAVTRGLQRSVMVNVCYPDGVDSQGHPVQVRLTSPFKLLPILGWGSLDLRADATMRLEQQPTHIIPDGPCP